MNPKVINPYSPLGNKHKQSLDYIIAHLTANPAFDDLNAQLTDSFYLPDPNDPTILDFSVHIIRTILPHAYNGYVNSGATDSIPARDGIFSPTNGYMRYNEIQKAIISQTLNGINNIPAEAIAEYLTGMEETIVSGKLSYGEQIPLLIAIANGKSDSEYWLAQIAAPAAWAAYLNADAAINNAYVAGWVSAAMQGALLTYGLVRPPQIQLVDIFSSTPGSVGLAAGRVIFGWVPRG